MNGHPAKSQRAFALTLALACLMVLALIGGALAQIVGRERVAMTGEVARAQCALIAESALEEAALMLAQDAGAQGSAGRRALSSLDGEASALVTIRIEPGAQEDARVVRIEVLFDKGTVTPVRASKTARVRLDTAGVGTPNSVNTTARVRLDPRTSAGEVP